MTAAAVTDVKGDRSQAPGQQDDPDMYLHVVDRNDEGIVVRGAKAHTSGSVGAEELIVIPTRALVEGEDGLRGVVRRAGRRPGLRMVCRGMSMAHDDDEFEVPISAHDDLVETLTIFDDVFVPYERVFLLRRVRVRRRDRQHVRQRQPPGLPRHRGRQDAAVRRRRAADRRAQRRRAASRTSATRSRR